ncbi:FRG domain-containing protein [Candidatus Poribacteria bacterium]|nr:FRG domain-containing protein [Candidatus Poribacteria bacterium]
MTTVKRSESESEISKVREKIQEIEDKTLGGNYIFRGEPKCYTEVSSGLWRGYRQILRDDLDIERIQREIVINHARQHLAGSIDNNDLGFGHSALQILIQLQHYGGKTNLIDFTTDVRVALFFACDGFHDEVGRVILRKREDIEGLVESPWEPNEPMHRVVAQSSIFVRPNKGYLTPDPDSIVEIPDALKVPILKYLQK